MTNQSKNAFASRLSTCARTAVLFVGVLSASTGMAVADTPVSASAPTVAYLGTHFQNDNEMYEPTSDAERARLKKVEEIFTTKLQQSGQYKLMPVPADVQAKIEKGQAVGECGGCEIDYGRAVKADRIAWIRIQKVSNLILNMNVYMADVSTEKMTFVRSVDIRGNTDDSWSIGIKWLIKHYMFQPVS